MARQPRDVNILTSDPRTIDEVFHTFRAGFRARKFSAGLLVAFVDMFRYLRTPALGLTGWEDFTRHFPPLQTNRRGAANTLTVEHKGTQLTLRRFYDPVETLFRATYHRMDYPNCAPHATQAWNEPRYRSWLDVLVRSSDVELETLRQQVVHFILAELPDHSSFDAREQPKPPLFRMALSEFDMAAQRGERSGAPFQGLVFAFLRADNPHLQVTASKVRTGGARHGAVGDVDCWDGPILALTAEVKHFIMSEEDVMQEISDFSQRVRQKAALGLVAALGFGGGAADAVVNMGLLPVTHDEIVAHVRLWEPHKQVMAINYAIYAFLRLEMSDPLTRRFQEFVAEASKRFGQEPPPMGDVE